MQLEEVVKDKTKKAKEKVEIVGKWLLERTLRTDELLAFAENAKDSDKATCIEALEFATKLDAGIADESVLDFVTKSLGDKAPRVKWESAKVIGNIAVNFPKQLDVPIRNLLVNANYDGTVVRWAAAYALGEILKLKTDYNKELLGTIESLASAENENGVKKKYLDALKKLKK